MAAGRQIGVELSPYFGRRDALTLEPPRPRLPCTWAIFGLGNEEFDGGFLGELAIC